MLGRTTFLAALLVLALPFSAAAQPDPAPAPPPATPAPTPDPAPDPASAPAPDKGTDEPSPPQPAPPSEHTAASVQGAPSAVQATGVARPEAEATGNKLRIVPRVLLYPVRGLFWVVTAIPRGAAWAYERYRLRDRWKSIFFNDTGTIGLYPVALVETGFGLNAGARFVHRDLFGGKESLKLRASFGGRFRQIYAIKIDSGERLGKTAVELEGEYEIRPRDRFFGIGNADLTDSVAMPVDPYMDPVAVDTRFRQNVGRASLIADTPLAGPLSARISSALFFRRYDESDDADIGSGEESLPDAYDPAALPGFVEGTDYLYNELELRLDTRGRATRYEPITVPSTGFLLAGYAGISSPMNRATADYVRYGADLQIYARLDASPRVLVLRALVEEVKGSLEEIPFSDLPRLGGPLLLRGYDQDRFRDRAMALASAEYQFDLSNMFSAFTFADLGRVYPELVDIEAKDLRFGYGGGLQMHTDNAYLGRVSLASSLDGGLFFHLSFDPVYDPKARVERK